ncbi:MAG: Peptidase protein [Patescibacteria group bacterium]|nr:Peptidase protein [Patescibacteria group bacterium]
MSILLLALFAVGVKAGASWALPSGGNPPAMNIFPPVNVGDVLQFKNGNFVAQGLKSTVSAIFEGSLQITAGTGVPAAGKVLTSDATGMASWQTPSGGGNGTGNVDNNNIDGTTNYVTKWTGPHTIGNSQIFDNATGVGIATTSPASGVKLDVNGKVKMTGFQLGSSATAGYVLTSDIDGNGTWQPSGGGGAGGWSRDGATQTVRLATPTDLVGIGTSTPTQQLEITKNFKLPSTANQGTAGVIYVGDDRFMHGYGVENTFIGRNSGNLNLGGTKNTGVGFEALKNITSGDRNVAIGGGAGKSIYTSGKNTAIGVDASGNNDGSYNTSFGYQALQGAVGVNNSENVAIGANALKSLGGSVGNTAIGYNAMDSATSGYSNNTVIGYNADVGSGADNAVAIGANAIASVSETMVFGDGNVKGWGFGAQPGGSAIKVGYNSTNGNGAALSLAGIWQNSSDRNKKHNIQDINYGLDTILELRPVSFDWNGTNEHNIGFIAQEVKEIIPEVVSGEDGSMTMSYGNMTAVLTKAVQDLKNDNDELRARLEALKLKIKNN